MDEKKFFKKSDIIVILIILVLGIGTLLYNNYQKSSNDLIAVISFDNREVMRIDLSEAENGTFALEEDTSIIFEIKDGSIGFIHSDCPDQVCVAAGFLDQSGESAVCLPYKVILKIISGYENDDVPDAVVR